MKWDSLLGDASRLRPPSDDFVCYETSDPSVSTEGTLFHCLVPTDVIHSSGKAEETTNNNYNDSHSISLVFQCRAPSYGVLEAGRVEASSVTSDEQDTAIPQPEGTAKKDEEIEAPIMLFDEGFTLTAKTGFQVWPGSRIMVEAFLVASNQCQRLSHWQERTRTCNAQPLRILELGAGVGVVGTVLAAAGAQVLMTDLPTVVEESLLPNLQRNSASRNNQQQDSNPSKPTEEQHDSKSKCPKWLRFSSEHNLSIGKGWVGASALDWLQPQESPFLLSQQNNGTENHGHLDLILACDCVWLRTLLKPFLDTVQVLFEHHHDCSMTQKQTPTLLMSLQRRDPDMWTTVEEVLEEIHARNWKVECLAWHPGVYQDNDKDENNAGTFCKDVFLFEVTAQ